MTRYHVHFNYGDSVLPDLDGMELADPEAACEEADTAADELAHPLTGLNHNRWQVSSIGQPTAS